MTLDDRIYINDTVQVRCYVDTGYHTIIRSAIVLYMPLSAGDMWIFKCSESNDIFYVTQPITVTKQHNRSQ